MLIIHIGLPKTATTFLQHQIFNRTEGLRFVHRSTGPAGHKLCEAFRNLASAASEEIEEHRQTIRRRLLRAKAKSGTSAAPVTLVSDENISIHWSRFWDGEGSSPRDLARRFADLRHDLADAFPAFRVLIGIRRQDQWLGSRYAESSKSKAEFGQPDFDRRMAEVAAVPRLDGPLAWLDYAGTRDAFAEALGRENVMLLPTERLRSDARTLIDEMSGFIGVDLRTAYDAIPEASQNRRSNRLSIGKNSWRLRKNNTPLHLAPALERTLRARFAESNRALAAEIALGFEP